MEGAPGSAISGFRQGTCLCTSKQAGTTMFNWPDLQVSGRSKRDHGWGSGLCSAVSNFSRSARCALKREPRAGHLNILLRL